MPEFESLKPKENEDIARAKLMLSRLGLSLDDLSGKKILDVGSGNGELERVANNLDLKIVGLDIDPHMHLAGRVHRDKYPNLYEKPYALYDEEESMGDIRERIKHDYSLVDTPNFVVGDAKRLPFADNSFDLLLSHASPPTTWTSDEEIVQVISEFGRVLNDGGEARFGPVFEHGEHWSSHINRFKNLNFTELPIDKNDPSKGYYLTFTKQKALDMSSSK